MLYGPLINIKVTNSIYMNMYIKSKVTFSHDSGVNTMYAVSSDRDPKCEMILYSYLR